MVKKVDATIALVILVVLAVMVGYFLRDALLYRQDHVILDGHDCRIERTLHGGQNLFGPPTNGDEVLVFAHCP